MVALAVSVRMFEALGLPSFADLDYCARVTARARELGTDGCSGPTLPMYTLACYEHDVHYRTHRTLFGRTITQAQADRVLRERIQSMSPLDGWSPMAQWRYFVLRWFGRRAWEGEGRGTPLAEHPVLYRWPCREAPVPANDAS